MEKQSKKVVTILSEKKVDATFQQLVPILD